MAFCGAYLIFAVWIHVTGAFSYDQDTWTPAVHTDEYCSTHTFSPRCAPGEVIALHSALYGRMRVGKCVLRDIGYLGCAGDMLGVLDRRCSGRQSCEVRVPDDEMDTLTTCSTEVTKYLEVTYSCVKVITPAPDSEGRCHGPRTVTLPTLTLHVSSRLLEVSDCGSRLSPWILEAQPGQRFNITLIDFSQSARLPGNAFPPLATCRETSYGEIVDLVGDNRVSSVCTRVGGKRESHVTVTHAHRAQLTLTSGVARGQQQQSRNFLLRISVLGCADLVAPAAARMERHNDALLVSCDQMRQSWQLTCHGTQWTGVIGNCSQHVHTAEPKQQHVQSMELSHRVAILTISAVSILISCTIIAIGVVCIRRHVVEEKRYESASLGNDYLKVSVDQQKAAGLYESYQAPTGHHHHEVSQHYSRTTSSNDAGSFYSSSRLPAPTEQLPTRLPVSPPHSLPLSSDSTHLQCHPVAGKESHVTAVPDFGSREGQACALESKRLYVSDKLAVTSHRPVDVV